jgi:hypothetical protein
VCWCAAQVPHRLLGALAELDRLAQQGEVSEELALESLRLF